MDFYALSYPLFFHTIPLSLVLLHNFQLMTRCALKCVNRNECFGFPFDFVYRVLSNHYNVPVSECSVFKKLFLLNIKQFSLFPALFILILKFHFVADIFHTNKWTLYNFTLIIKYRAQKTWWSHQLWFDDWSHRKRGAFFVATKKKITY